MKKIVNEKVKMIRINMKEYEKIRMNFQFDLFDTIFPKNFPSFMQKFNKHSMT